MEIEDWPNLVAMFLANAEARRERPFLWEKRNGVYQSTSWGEAAHQVSALASALQARGLGPGDRVLLLANNSPRWVIADFAIMAAGCVTVPVYTTNTISNHTHILGDIDASAAIVSTATLARPFLEAARQFETLRHVIAMEDWGDLDRGNAVVTSWDDAVAEGKTGAGAVAAAAPAIDRDATAAVIYTSGTGGNPRGVMLSHRSIIANCVGAAEVLEEVGLDDEVFLSFLPLSHAYEHSAGLMFPVSIGAQIYFAERVDTLTSNLLEARPTIMTSVPRLYEVMREKILRDVSRQGGLREKLFSAAVMLGRKRYESPEAMTWTERIADRVVDRLVRDTFRSRFGGRLKALVSGGAPLNYGVGLFLTALGLRLLQGYGQTEAGPVITCNRCGRIKLRTVGPPLKHVELRIADDGEVLVRGPLLMDGYWRQPEASAEALREGWLHTGDIGVVDDDGYLRITDRKKDIIVNSAGETISPQKIELELALEPEIDAAMAVGDNRPHIVAIIVPASDFVTRWTESRGVSASLAELRENRDFIGAIGQAVDRANRNLAPAERVKRFVVVDQPFTIENGMMTPTMKPRRHMILNRWGPAIDEAGR
ncbi:AMP-dependent synthetase/ligase [Bauldia litoralis]|uniref:Long-chain acyl-CoA synthetase n=1 Tax=Bauldia litoralis TaxID=665467 RepID=A0A1G6EN47_9HYPH|nr:AMP-dependent synthetase/ligase [Bauldia litoralis]SDB58305.1 long-chain acyl-CoA synthetase [Bauldia litoralis]